MDLATRRTLVMSVRYALRISVDDATEETPSAAYRSGSPESVESGAAGILMSRVCLRKRSGHVKGARTMRRRRASGRGGRSADPWRTEDGGSSRVRGRGLGAGRRARCVRRSDARERRDDGKTRRGKRSAKTGGGEPAKRLEDDSIGPIGGEQTRFIGTRWVNGCRPDASIIFLSDWRGALKKRSAGKTHSRRGRSPFRGDRRARALLIRTMVSPNATDDPESAEKQPEVRALYDRRAPLDERGRASRARFS